MVENGFQGSPPDEFFYAEQNARLVENDRHLSGGGKPAPIAP